MKIDRFIYSTDENPNYIYSWPLVSKVTKKIFDCDVSLAFITDRCDDDKLVDRMKEFGNVHLFKTMCSIPIGNQAKVSRMYTATLYPEEVCVLNDVDLLPLQKDFLINLLHIVPDDCLAAIGRNAYDNSAEAGKFPMIYTSAKGKIFNEIINKNNLPYEETLNQWVDIKIIDYKESINGQHYNFSDESLLRALIHLWDNKNKVVYLDRNDFVGMRATKRIDRANWRINQKALNENYYIDAHLPKPLNVDMLLPVLEHFNISKEEIIL